MIGPVRTVLRYLGGTVLVSMLIVTGVVIGILRTADVDDRSSADAIVVLGAAQYNGAPSPVLQARLDHAAELYRSGVAPRIVTIGGGQSGDVTNEGAAGRDYLADLGIDAAALESVGVGDDTLASLRAARDELAARDWNSVVLVTDPWHAARAQLIADDLGLAAQVSSVQEGPSLRDGVETRYVTRETLGILFYLLTGGSSGAGSTVV
ncbi:MAG TPA: YdcF family protein [Nakamurella sp.]|nr:YdcF family protein [Nakamurella sp.]